uniref:F-box domain-containing protein n=1 Tax=Acrobeloides nanus TaxID=290746 RepID=A0A914DY56_9BILA
MSNCTDIFRWIEHVFSTKHQLYIPTDILLTVFQYLDGASLGQALFVCNHWSQTIQENRSYIPRPYNFFTNPILIKGEDVYHIVVYQNRKNKTIYFEDAVKDFWNPRTILYKLVIYANPYAYRTVKNLMEHAKFLFKEAKPIKVKKLKIISNRWNRFNILHKNRGFFQEMAETEKLSVHDRVSITINDDYKYLGGLGIKFNKHLSINVRNGTTPYLIGRHPGIYRHHFIKELSIRSIFVRYIPYHLVTDTAFVDERSTRQFVNFLCDDLAPVHVKRTYWLCILDAKYTNLMETLINKFNHVDDPRRFCQQATLYVPAMKSLIQESQCYLEAVLQLVPSRSRSFLIRSYEYEVKRPDGWILNLRLQVSPISCIKLKICN